MQFQLYSWMQGGQKRIAAGKVGWPLCAKATIFLDHRVSDGAEAAQPKVQKLAEFLENRVRMLV